MDFRGLRGGSGGIRRLGTGHSRLVHPFRRLQAPVRSPAFDLARLNAELLRRLTVGLAVVARHKSQSTACTRDHEPVRHGTPVIVASMHKHRAVRLFLTVGAGLLTTCASPAWPLVIGSLLLTALTIVIALLVGSDERTPFERIVVLLCVLRRIDPRSYLALPEPARRKGADPGSAPRRVPASPAAGRASRRPRAGGTLPADNGK